MSEIRRVMRRYGYNPYDTHQFYSELIVRGILIRRQAG